MSIVLGGGISGLAAAHYLLKKSKYVPKIFEASDRFGGWIKTDSPSADRTVRFEAGPRTLRPMGERGVNALALCSELGLAKDVLPITPLHPAAKNRMLAVQNELCLLPSSVTSAFKTSRPFSKPLIYALYHDYSNGYTGDRLTDDTIYNFAERRFGTEIAKYLVSSMMCGICAGDAKQISVKFMFDQLFEYEQNHSSVTKGFCAKVVERLFKKGATENAFKQYASDDLVKKAMGDFWRLYSLKDGMEKLPKTLANHLKTQGAQLNTQAKCEHIEFQSDRATVTVNGQTHETGSLISALPAFELSKLMRPQHPQLADELQAIPYVDVAVVNFQFAGTDLLETPAFGFLVPPTENLPILGVIFDSCCFEMGDNTVLTVMMGGKWFRERFGNGDENQLYDSAIEQIRRFLNIQQKPVAYKVNILRQCIPQYVVGHYQRVERIMKYIESNKMPLRLCGSAYDGVGVNDAIFSAKVAVNSL